MFLRATTLVVVLGLLPFTLGATPADQPPQAGEPKLENAAFVDNPPNPPAENAVAPAGSNSHPLGDDTLSDVVHNKWVVIGAALGFGYGLLVIVFGRRRRVRGIWAVCVLVGATLVGAVLGYLLFVFVPLAIGLAILLTIAYLIYAYYRYCCCRAAE